MVIPVVIRGNWKVGNAWGTLSNFFVFLQTLESVRVTQVRNSCICSSVEIAVLKFTGYEHCV